MYFFATEHKRFQESRAEESGTSSRTYKEAEPGINSGRVTENDSHLSDTIFSNRNHGRQAKEQSEDRRPPSQLQNRSSSAHHKTREKTPESATHKSQAKNSNWRSSAKFKQAESSLSHTAKQSQAKPKSVTFVNSELEAKKDLNMEDIKEEIEAIACDTQSTQREDRGNGRRDTRKQRSLGIREDTQKAPRNREERHNRNNAKNRFKDDDRLYDPNKPDSRVSLLEIFPG